MRLLILTAFYPVPGGTHERMFVHVRNQYYQQHGAEVTVLNFAAENTMREEMNLYRSVLVTGGYKLTLISFTVALCILPLRRCA